MPLRRSVSAVIPKPTSIIAHDDGSGTAGISCVRGLASGLAFDSGMPPTPAPEVPISVIISGPSGVSGAPSETIVLWGSTNRRASAASLSNDPLSTGVKSIGALTGVPSSSASGLASRTFGRAASRIAVCRFCFRLASAPRTRSPGERSSNSAATVLRVAAPWLILPPIAVTRFALQTIVIASAAATPRAAWRRDAPEGP